MQEDLPMTALLNALARSEPTGHRRLRPVAPDLWATAPETLAGPVNTCGFLIERDEGNAFVYSSSSITDYYDHIDELVMPTDLQAALDASPDAQGAYEALRESAKKQYLWWIQSAKRPATRARRIEEIEAGLGAIVVIIPDDVSAQVSVDGVLANVATDGPWLEADGGVYRLGDTGSGNQIKIDVEMGPGSLELRAP